MRKLEWFETWFGTPYYNILYNNRNEQEAADFINLLLETFPPEPQARMIDIACGHGRHSIQLAEKGFEVTGIDISAASIAKAKNFETEKLEFFIHDMRLPFRRNYFDYAFNFFTSFGYFENRRDNFRAANAFAKNIKPGGLLMVDYLNANPVKNQSLENQVLVKEGLEFNISKEIENGRVNKYIKLKDISGGIHHFKESVQLFSFNEMKNLFTKQGLELIDVFGNYQLEKYDEANSPRDRKSVV